MAIACGKKYAYDQPAKVERARASLPQPAMITELRERGVSNVTQLGNQTETQLYESKAYIHKATHVTPTLQSTTFRLHDSIHNISWRSKLESHCRQQYM